MEIIRNYIRNNIFYKRPTIMELEKIDTLVLHSTGDAAPSAKNHVNYYNNESVNVAVHAFIDGNTGDVHEVLPLNYKGAHAGAGGMNSHSIGVEMCEPDGFIYAGGATVWSVINRSKCLETIKRTYESAVEYFAHLIVERGLNIKNIYGHGELRRLGLSTTTHVDPEHLWNYFGIGYTMNGFREDVWGLVEQKRSGKMEPVYNKLGDIPTAYRDTISKLIDTGLLNGYNDGLGLTRDMCRILTILDRGGLFDGTEKKDI